MKALLLILSVAGVAVASEVGIDSVVPEAAAVVPEHVPVQADAVVPEHVPVKADAVETHEMRLIPVYGLPKVEAKMYERLSMRAIAKKPLYLAVRMEGKKELEIFMLHNGFESIFKEPNFEYLAKHLLSGPEKVGLIQNAAQAMQIPDLYYTISDIRISSDLSPIRASLIEMDGIVPWVFIIPKSELPVVPEKLFEIGTFQIRKDGIMVARDFTPAITEVTGTRYLHDSLPVEGIVKPVLRTEGCFPGFCRTAGGHQDLQRVLQLRGEPVFQTDGGIVRAHSLHHGLHHDDYIPYVYRYSPLLIRGSPSYFTV